MRIYVKEMDGSGDEYMEGNTHFNRDFQTYILQGKEVL